jgi:hypothetical protein
MYFNGKTQRNTRVRDVNFFMKLARKKYLCILRNTFLFAVKNNKHGGESTFEVMSVKLKVVGTDTSGDERWKRITKFKAIKIYNAGLFTAEKLLIK